MRDADGLSAQNKTERPEIDIEMLITHRARVSSGRCSHGARRDVDNERTDSCLPAVCGNSTCDVVNVPHTVYSHDDVGPWKLDRSSAIGASWASADVAQAYTICFRFRFRRAKAPANRRASAVQNIARRDVIFGMARR